jgi:exonuclease III
VTVEKKKKRRRGGRQAKRKEEKRRGRRVNLVVGSLNVGTMTGKGRELADLMERRKVDVLCVQETKWRGSKAKKIGGGYKLFYHGKDGRRNGIGVIVKEEYINCVLEVKRVSDRVMCVKIEKEDSILNIISAYAPQVGCDQEEKEKFWNELDETTQRIPGNERIIVGADFNGHIGEGNKGDEDVIGKYCVGKRNTEGQEIIDFAKRMKLAVVNSYFRKREEHRVTYKSGGRSTQIDYIMCKRCNLKEFRDCTVMPGESVTTQQ